MTSPLFPGLVGLGFFMLFKKLRFQQDNNDTNSASVPLPSPPTSLSRNCKYERGSSVAFNVRDLKNGMVHPEVVQKLAEREKISLGIGYLSHIKIIDSRSEDSSSWKPVDKDGRNNGFIRVEVVTASFAFLTNFEDVYRLWNFVAKFLNPGFGKQGTLPTVIEEDDSSET